MRIRARPTQTLIALLAGVGLLVVSAPGLAAAALGASEIRWELRNANTAGQPDIDGGADRRQPRR
jgi:hypothetical protein